MVEKQLNVTDKMPLSENSECAKAVYPPPSGNPAAKPAHSRQAPLQGKSSGGRAVQHSREQGVGTCKVCCSNFQAMSTVFSELLTTALNANEPANATVENITEIIDWTKMYDPNRLII